MILCCGEALMDMIPEAGAYVPHTGGAVFNTAIALARLEVPVGMLTGLSRDLFGQRLAGDLAANGVDCTHVIAADRPTTLAFVELDGGQARYHFWDENSAGRMIAPADLPALSPEVKALFFGGISLAVEPGADTYGALLAREGSGHLVMLDPNIRPGFIPDRNRYLARLTAMLRCADVVKLSDEDLTWIDPGAGSLVDKARRLRDLGPAVVIVTEGAAGAFAVGSAETDPLRVAAPKADVVDTVGAGDTFNAGVLAGLADLDALHKTRLRALPLAHLRPALALGAAAAAVTVARAGANPPKRAELRP